jgi:cell division protein FtsI/penicillin-binding protein 2
VRIHQRRAHRRTSRAVGVGTAAVLVLGTLTACQPGTPEPDAVAQALADGIAGADLTDVPLTGATPAEATEQLTTALAGLEPWRPTVEVDTITVDDEGATAGVVLDVTWDVDSSEQDWTYRTEATLDLVDDAWVARWSLTVVAPDLVPGLVLATRRVPAARASVLGAGGQVLVEPRPVLRLGVDKTRVDAAGQPESARQVAELLGLDPGPYAERVAAAGERAFVEALVVRAQDPGVDLDAFATIPGALAVDDQLPLAPTRRFARPILGVAGAATAEIVEESGGSIAAGDIAGLSGLQRQYDEQLRGLPGLTIVVVREDTGDERELFHTEPVPGEALVLTLDPAVQEVAESVLEPVGPASGLVAIRPSTGEVLAAASGPGGDGYSTATLGTFAPGSVFKVVSSLALLRAGLTPESPVECPASATVDGRVFNNFPDYPAGSLGTIELRTAVAQSCNTAFIGSRDLAPASALADAAASLGIGVERSLGYPAFLGSVPGDATGTDAAASMIGQGRIQVSPLAMATVAASVAAGRTVVPWLVGSTPPEATAPPTELSAAEAEALRALMRAVVTEGGGGFLADVPGEPVLAKTGTAQTGSGADLHNHAWMVAVQGDLAVAVFVETGEYGSTTAGPLLEQFLFSVATLG